MNFKYQLKKKPIDIHSNNPVESFLKNVGIRKTKSFLDKPEESDYINPRLLKNIDEAVDKIHLAFQENKRFYLQPDPDADGICSAAIFYAYFKELYPESIIDYEIQMEKEHGIRLEKIPNWSDVVVIVDAGSNDFAEQQEIIRQGRDLIILDHHLVDNLIEVEGVTLVNNQLSPEYDNKFLSGAGVVYKFIHLYSEKYGDGKAHKRYMDLAALGLISDMMDSRELDNHYLIYHGLQNIVNPMFKSLLIKQSYSISSSINPSKIDIAFYITPLMNAVTRFGSFEENTELFKAFAEYNNTDTTIRTYRGRIIEETLYEKVARESSNIRNRQNNFKEKIVNFLDSRVEETGIGENAILTIISSNTDEITLPKTMTGLVAMDFVKRYRKPTLIMRPRIVNGTEALYGSGRANPAAGFTSFKDELNESQLVEFAQGHDMAFGVGVKKENLTALNEYMNKKLKDVDFGSEEIEVDYIFDHETLPYRVLFDFASKNFLYGNMIPTPKFVFKFVLNKNSFDVIGKNKTTMKFRQDSIEFIKFNSSEEIKLFTDDEVDFVVEDDLVVTVIGTPKINEFAGNTTLQILIEHISAEKYDKYSLL